MEKRLQEYRRLKAEKLAEKGGPHSARSRHSNSQATESDNLENAPKEEFKADDENQSSDEEKKFQKNLKQMNSKLNEQLSFWERYYLETVLKFLLWACLFGFFVQVGFGAVYFIISLFYLMYTSMTSKSRRGVPSAYSVFNKDCERINGTFTAEQFESQLRTGTLR